MSTANVIPSAPTYRETETENADDTLSKPPHNTKCREFQAN